MASSNIDYNLFFDQFTQNVHRFGSCKSEANRSGNQQTVANHKEMHDNQKIHISTNGYYGHNTITPWISAPERNEERAMDCEMAPISPHRSTEQRTLGRKRCSDDVNFVNFKRFRRDEFPPLPPMEQPTLTSGTFVRPTHTNPDISRCLMAHMI